MWKNAKIHTYSNFRDLKGKKHRQQKKILQFYILFHVYLNFKSIKNKMKIWNCIFIKVLNQLLNINFMVEKNVCTHNLSVSTHYLIAIVMKHILLVWNIFLQCTLTWARTSFHHTSQTTCRQYITSLPALKKYYCVILCKLKYTFK